MSALEDLIDKPLGTLADIESAILLYAGYSPVGGEIAAKQLAASRLLLDECAAALKPFAEWAGTIYKEQDDDDTKDICVDVGDLRKAADLLRRLSET